MQLKKKDASLMDKVRGFVFALAMLEAPAFFAIYAIMGKTYDRLDSSLLYVIYMVSLLVLLVLFFIYKRQVPKNILLWLLFPIAFVGLAWITAKVYQQNLYLSNIRNVVLWQYTGIFLAFNVYVYKAEDEIVKPLIALMYVITIGSVISVLIPFLRGGQIDSIAGYSLSGSTFQAQTYNTALCIGINLFFLLDSQGNRLQRISSFFLLGVQLICAILYAGRGGIILVAVYLIAFYLLRTQNNSRIQNRLMTVLLYLVLFVIGFIVLRYIIVSSPFLMQRFDRIFSYISNGKIDMSQTSNRNIVYSSALYYIKESPLVGYGILGYMYLDGLNRYPHNIVMEMLLEGGVGYLFIWIFVIVIAYKKMSCKKNSVDFQLFLLPFLFAIVKLMFSGTYSYEMLFWFSIVYSFVSQRERFQHDEKDYNSNRLSNEKSILM